jgi:hypothetical protein
VAGTPWTRVGLLVAALLVLAHPGAALAVTNSVAFSGKLAMATTPSTAAPANTAFEWAHQITTVPAGGQPDTAVSFKVLFPSPLILNAQDFPACLAWTADGQTTLSDDCKNAIVGSGTATMYAGSPGSPLGNSVREDLAVTVLNGSPAGSAMLLLLNSTPSAPVVIRNRVVTGNINPEQGFAFGSEFNVPADLQNQLGLSIVVTDLDVTISGTPRPITVGTTTRNISYLQLPDCGSALPARQLTNFRAVKSTALTTLTSDTSVPCAIGSFPDPPGFPVAPYTSQRVPAPNEVDPPDRLTVPAISLGKAGTKLGRVKARRNGSVHLPGVAGFCPAEAAGPCPVSGRATRGRVIVATLRFRLAAGAHTPLTLKLTRAGRRLLARKKSLPLAVALKVATPAGAPVGSVAQKTLRLTLVR